MRSLVRLDNEKRENEGEPKCMWDWESMKSVSLQVCIYDSLVENQERYFL